MNINKLTDEQIEKITEEILNETFPNYQGEEDDNCFAYEISRVSLLMLKKFLKKIQEL